MSKTNPAPNTSLFRIEATRAKSNQGFGSIQLAQPISGWVVAWSSFVISLLLITFICFGSVTSKARAVGIVVPVGGTVSINSQQSGTLLRSTVKEGDHVKAGQVLFELSTERQGERGEISALVEQQMAVRIQSLQSELRIRVTQAQEKSASLKQRISSAGSEIALLKEEISLAQRRCDLASETVKKYQALLVSNYVSQSQVQQKQEDEIDVRTRLSALHRNLLQLESSLVDLRAEEADTRTSAATEQVQIERSISSIRQDIEENRSRKLLLVVAPESGTVGALSAIAGQSLSSGAVLATLIPDSADTAHANLQAHLYVPSRTSGFITEGQTVMIRYQAFPYQKFGLQKGKVVDVSRTPFAPNELPQNLASTILSNAQDHSGGANSNEALFRIRVALEKQTIQAYGREQALKPGMTLDADLLQDRRKIWEWILEPLIEIKESGTVK